MALEADACAAILVEGWSDQAAVDALARRRGWDLRSEGILTLPIAGVTNLGAFIQALGPSGLGLRLAGLCDAAEEDYVKLSLERAGMGAGLNRAGLEAIGFFVCEADLEDELIRALGTTGVEAVLRAQGEFDSFRRFQEQPAQRGRELGAQLRRFMGTRAGRKIRYGALLVDALALARVPRALDSVITYARGDAGQSARPQRAAKPRLLAGGNPQIAKAEGEAPVQAYIAAMPAWKRDIGSRLDALVSRTVPGVRKAVKWNSPFYGSEGRGWFLSFHCFTRYVKVTFFRGASLRPLPPGESKQKEVRYLDIREDEPIDEVQLAAWIRQASRLPGWGGA